VTITEEFDGDGKITSRTTETIDDDETVNPYPYIPFYPAQYPYYPTAYKTEVTCGQSQPNTITKGENT
jgi:hypothetical protein